MKKKNFIKIFVVVLTGFFLAGCIRLVGGAGVSYQGPKDEAPKTRSVSLDTQNLIPGSAPSDAKIEM